MASTRLSQRFPVRPAAERSPSPDMGSKSLILRTTPPKVNKEHLISKKERDESIIRIREENKKLKEEMREILVRNKQNDRQDISQEKERETQRNRIEAKSQILTTPPTLRQTQKPTHSSTKPPSPSPHSSFLLSIPTIKQQLSLLLRSKQQSLIDRLNQLEARLHHSQLLQTSLKSKLHRSPLQTSIKRKIDFDYSPSRLFLEHSPSPSFLSTPPVRQLSPSNSHRDLVHSLQIQLSGAQSTIRRLETILETEEKSYDDMRGESQKKEREIEELKREWGREREREKREREREEREREEGRVMLERKESGEKREIRIFYQKQITNLNNQVQSLQTKILTKQKQLRDLQRSKIQFRQKLQQQKSSQILTLHQQINNHKQQIKRLSQQANSSILSSQLHFSPPPPQLNIKDTAEYQALQYKLTLISNQLQSSRSYITTLESENEKLREVNGRYQNEISYLGEDNGKLKDSFSKLRVELDQIVGINSRLTVQKGEVEELTIQLTSAFKSLESTKQSHKSQTMQYLNQVKDIRSLTESITISQPIDTQLSQDLQHQLSSIKLKHRQQILTLESQIITIEADKGRLQKVIDGLERDNQVLKEEVEGMNQAIRVYSRPIIVKEMSGEEIEGIIMKESMGDRAVGERVGSVGKVLSEVSGRLGRLYDEVSGEQYRLIKKGSEGQEG